MGIGIGMGVGCGALLNLSHELVARRCRVEFLLVTATESPFGLLDARRVGSATHVIRTGSSTDQQQLLGQLQERIDECAPGVVYSAGTPDDVALVAQAVGETDVPHQCALDFRTGCATGFCSGCALPVRGNDGVTRMVRMCVDGAVFNADLVRWPDLYSRPDEHTDFIGQELSS